MWDPIKQSDGLVENTGEIERSGGVRERENGCAVDPAVKPREWTLRGGDLFVMRGQTQKEWQHRYLFRVVFCLLAPIF